MRVGDCNTYFLEKLHVAFFPLIPTIANLQTDKTTHKIWAMYVRHTRTSKTLRGAACSLWE